MSERKTKLFQGVAASPGIGIGPVMVIERRRLRVPHHHIAPEQIDAEIERLVRAVHGSLEQLGNIKKRLEQARKHEPVAIIDAQLLMLQDEVFLGHIEQFIRKQHLCAEWALEEALAVIRSEFDRLDDEYLRERRSDIDFLGRRILRHMMGEEAEPPLPLSGQPVVVAHELSPVDVASLARQHIAAFVTSSGGKTSHATIIARALGIPAVVGVEDLLRRVGQGDQIVVDGYRGEVWLHPSQAFIQRYQNRREELRLLAEKFLKEIDQPAQTTDGQRVTLSANLELVDEISTALRFGAEAVGLFRTEYLFLQRHPPSEGLQHRYYQKLLRGMGSRPVTIRTLDLGGDKKLPFLHFEAEANPALGLRSIRLSLRHRQLFITQLRALLRASVHGQLRIMFPMISGLRELQEARAALEEAKEQLRARGQAFSPDIKVGMMVEVPSAAVLADVFARQVDFFSVGTNDLVQYLLAADRQNKQVAYLFNPLHPAVLRILDRIVRAGHEAGISVSICGEMGGQPQHLLVVLGLGFDEVSMHPLALPYARHLMRHSKFSEINGLVKELLQMDDAEAIEQTVQQWMNRHFPDLFTAEGPAEILGGL